MIMPDLVDPDDVAHRTASRMTVCGNELRQPDSFTGDPRTTSVLANRFKFSATQPLRLLHVGRGVGSRTVSFFINGPRYPHADAAASADQVNYSHLDSRGQTSPVFYSSSVHTAQRSQPCRRADW
uniref:Uncharacterized protein n=1 Tax=Schistocephalus solidus TaxID=70667 RepID=A0A0X3Q498_SCHSO